jgi:SM-20-related protein
MSTTQSNDGQASLPHQAFLSQQCVYRNFLDAETHDALRAWALANEAKFEPTTVGGSNSDGGGRHDPKIRVSLAISDFGVIMPVLHRRLMDHVPTLIADLGVTSFTPSDLEIELVASNDGAFYKQHIDTFTGKGRGDADRLISAVYYFHTEPKAFSGGALRLHPMLPMDGSRACVDVEPEQNMLVAFPSWALHEVLPVSCPSKRFPDSRFSINLWVLRERVAGAAQDASSQSAHHG